MIFSQSLLVGLSTQTLFPSNKHFTCFTSFHLFMEIHFYSQQARALSLATDSHGLVVRIQCSPCHGLTSISGWEQKLCFKILLAKATPDQ